MSDSAFPVHPSLKPAPGIRRWTPGLHRPCAHLLVKFGCPVLGRADDSSMRRLALGVRLRPRGSRSDPGSSVPGHQRLFSPIRPTPGHIAISSSLQLIRDAFAVREWLESLRAAAPYELGQTTYSIYRCTAMYPVYVRGEAYLAAHQGSEAAAEFQKILDHRGIVLDEPIGALAHLQIGRAYAMQGDTAKARAAYQDFLTLWKDADPDIPMLIAAKSEYAKLK
jgi:hypothetical protein